MWRRKVLQYRVAEVVWKDQSPELGAAGSSHYMLVVAGWTPRWGQDSGSGLSVAVVVVVREEVE